MSAYTIPIKTAIITFPLFAMLFTLPFLIYQYRKHGYINYFRAFILYSFLLYSITAYYLIILPFPKTRMLTPKPISNFIRLVPFEFVKDILDETSINTANPSTYINLFKGRAFLQAFFNGILLLPLGICLRYYFNKSLKSCVMISFCVSLFFELTQLSGLYGYYNRPYRIFDVDDLILNTLGGYFGYMLSAICIKILPNVEKLDEHIQLENIPVRFIRRFLAFSFDWAIFALISMISRGRFKTWMFVFFYFIMVSYINKGRTFGNWLFRIEVAGKSEKLKFREVLVRYGVLYYLFFGINIALVDGRIADLLTGKSNIIYVVNVLTALMDLAVFVHVTIHFFSKDKRLFHDKISGTRLRVIS